MTFTIVNGQLVGQTGVDTSSNTVTLFDDMTVTDVQISKRNTGAEEIAGASLTLTGKDITGRDVVFDAANVQLGEGAAISSTGSVLAFTSGTAPTLIKSVPDGNYTLHEVAAPEGYEVTTDITFTVQNGKVIGVESNHVVMTDTRKGEAKISKQNAYGDEIPGAELTLTGKTAEGNDITFNVNDVILGNGARLVTTDNGTALTWVSGTSETTVKNLPNGTYVLHEVAAPSGYEVTTDITFTVTDGVISGTTGVESSSVTMMDDMKKTDVNISKVNVHSEEIPGATLTLTGKDLTGREISFSADEIQLGNGASLTGSGSTLTWVSGTTPTQVKNLPDGTYVLHEVAAPSGYVVTTDITFTIVDGKVTGDTGVNTDSSTVTMVDDDIVTTDVEISKRNVFGREIPGAKLTLTGKKAGGTTVEFDVTDVTLGNGAELVTRSNGNELTWISGTSSTLVGGLEDGTYVLHEVAAPSGYEVTTDITFTITNGQVTGEVGVESSSVTMVDDMVLTDVEICKKNTLSEEIPGATLTLTGKDFEGNTVVFDLDEVSLGEGAQMVSEADGQVLTWVSGTTSTFVRNLKDGTYVLHEVAAPSGYEVTTDITFTIVNGQVTGEVGVTTDSNTVTMVDDMTVVTTTTTAPAAATTTTTVATVAATAAPASTAAPTNAPQTGDNGVAAAMALITIAAGTAFALRRKHDED